ncbi:MAG: hypothetical protein FJW20_07210 [Acidimicrobiia bacterium]|nr:hypothetical protein [Acidimicrobiia bacterium]
MSPTLFRFAALACACGSLIFAQVSGRISGSVTDASGSAIPAAAVELFLPGGASPLLSTTTTSDGLFTFTGVRPDYYDLTITAPGFGKQRLRAIKVDAATELSLADIKMEVASVTETIEVAAQTVAVQTSNAEINTTISNSQIRRLPTINRSPLALITTQAGVTSNARSNTTINGLRPSYTNVTIDGINIQDNFIRTNALDYLPNLLLMDQVAEFTISTSNTNVAEGNGSSQVTFVTPSGGNDYHGSLYWYNRNNVASANTWFNNRNGVARPFLNQNQLGGTLGGHIIRDKFFFYGNYEALRLRQQSSATRTILTDSARRGIFTYRDTANNIRQVNVLQAAGVSADPRIQQILEQVPGPDKINRTDVGDQLNTAGYTFLLRNNRTRDNATIKLDYVLSTKHSFSGSYLWNRDQLDRPDLANDYSLVPKVQNDDNRDLVSITHRWSPSGRVTNELRGGFNLAPATFRSSENFGGSIITGFIFGNPINTFRDQGRFTDTYNIANNFSCVRGKHTFRAGYQNQLIRIQSFNDAGNLPSYALGISANNQFGLTGERLPGVRAQDITIANNLLSTMAGFITSSTQNFYVTSRSSGFVAGAANVRNFTLDNHSFYFQDSWKAMRRLTMTLGIRYEYFSPVDEANGLGLLPIITNGNPITTLLSNSTLDFAGGDTGRRWYNRDLNNWAPNVGLAWDLFGNGKTSVRAGYSINYANDEFIRATDNNVGTNSGLAQTVTTVGLVGRISAPPAITTPAFKVPRTFADNNLLNSQTAFGLIDPNLRTPYVQQWSFGIQQELFKGILELRYVGNHATKQFRAFDYNQVNIYADGFFEDFQRAFNNGNLARTATGTFNPAYNPAIAGSQQLPVFGRLANANLTNATIRSLIETGQVGELANTYQINRLNGPIGFYANPLGLGMNMLTNYSNASYNALQVDFNRRLSNGLQFQTNYTYSKVLSDALGDSQARFEAFLDINNAKIERARSPFDLTHSFSSNYVYELPFGREVKGPLGKLISGWTTGGIISWTSGTPFSVNSGRGTLNRGARSGPNTANTTLNKSQLNDLFALRFAGNGPYFVNQSAIGADGRGTAPDGRPTFDGQVFSNPGPGQLGALQRRWFDGPGFFNLDFSLLKTTTIQEGHTVEFRMESVNFLNHPNFSFGDQDINSVNFGRVTGTTGGRRVIQFGLYYRF